MPEPQNEKPSKVKPLAIAIMGPTAAGKTSLAIALSQALNGEIISVDSALIYKGMDIGTAKPSGEELKIAPHRLINILDPKESYSAADFCTDAKAEIAHVVSSGRTPILVGGTMMYFKSLLEGLSPMPPSDEDVREDIARMAKQYGWQYIHRKLEEVDPLCASKIHPNHSHRLSRALEVYLISNKTMSYWQQREKVGLLNEYHWVQIAVSVRERATLHQRIDDRFEQMLGNGFIDEVKALHQRGDLTKDMPSIRCVGYRQVWDYLEGFNTIDQLREKGKAATRQLAKRQFTWLKKWQNLHWIYTDDKHNEMLSHPEMLEKVLSIIRKR